MKQIIANLIWTLLPSVVVIGTAIGYSLLFPMNLILWGIIVVAMAVAQGFIWKFFTDDVLQFTCMMFLFAGGYFQIFTILPFSASEKIVGGLLTGVLCLFCLGAAAKVGGRRKKSE